MKISAALFLSPFVLLASAAPNANPAPANDAFKEKAVALSVREASPVDLHARAPVTATVNTDGVSWWDKMSNDYYISDAYVSWTGGVPDAC
ncbi:hypothetical protein EST38_g1780 [Candolleomyces aberdarensis]|uniref:Uncharacterized protein n=1 Tax=Candolleomyces aberdarensis TaxID=2316362 RepID=A0A4Q2DUN4_9AGAR|nr:hypothetical protein EST38_g1780 [Candolleomyces aberdarensis]